MNRRILFFDLCATALVLSVYMLTLAPTITWRHFGADSGDLVSAAFTLGIPHPTGYPLYTMLAALFTRLPLSEAAGNVALFSALATAGAFFFLLRTLRALSSSIANALTEFVSLSAALCFAFAPLVWSQAIIAEVYALNLFFVSLLLWSTFTRTNLTLAALTLGMGLAHHLSIIFFLPLTLFYFRRAHVRVTLASGFAFVFPLLAYLYIPVRAAAHPPINWGNAETFDGFIWLVSGAAYRGYLFNLTFGEFFQRVAFVARTLLDNFTLIGVTLGLWGITRNFMRERALAITLLFTFLLITLYSLFYVSTDSFVYLIPAFAIWTIWICIGFTDLVARTQSNALRYAIIGLLVLLPLWNLITHWETLDLSRDYTARDYAMRVLATMPNNAIVFADADEHLFALWYARYVLKGDSSRVQIVNSSLLQFDWYWKQMRGEFAGMADANDNVSRSVEIITASQRAGRAIYFTYVDDALLKKYSTHVENDLYRILK